MTMERLMMYYSTRPDSMKGQRLGQWFCNAFKLTDNQLYNATTASEAKRLIAERYDTYDQTFLVQYNASNAPTPIEGQPLGAHSRLPR